MTIPVLDLHHHKSAQMAAGTWKKMQTNEKNRQNKISIDKDKDKYKNHDTLKVEQFQTRSLGVLWLKRQKMAAKEHEIQLESEKNNLDSL